MARAKRKSAHRPHRPAELGPRTYLRGRWYWIDLRPFGGDRQPIRNPKHPLWPEDGDRTTDAETARRWAWAYLDHVRNTTKRKHLGLRAPAKPLGVEVERFLAHRDRTAAVKTAVGNNAPLAIQLVPFLGAEQPCDTIDREAMQRWVDHLVDRGYAIGTVRTYLAVARSFFRWRSDGLHDPTRGVEMPDPGERDVEPWTDEELGRLREAADKLDRRVRPSGPRSPVRSYRLLLECGIATGCRVAELGALAWSAFDAHERTVRIRAQVPADGYARGLQPLKGRRNRTALVLPSWWDFHDERATCRVVLKAGVESISHRALERWFAQIIEAAGVGRDGQNAHTTRHTYARLALEMGARLEELQRFLGHASIRTTEAYYGWLTDQSATSLARARVYGEALRLVRSDAGAARRA